MAKKKIDDTTQILVWKIPIRIKRQFKSRCVRNGVKMRDVLIDFIQAYAARK